MHPNPVRTCFAAGLLALLVSAGTALAAAAPAAAPDTSGVTVAPDAGADSAIARAIARMDGVIPGSDSLVDWALFRAQPQRTIGLIVPGLKPVPRTLWLGAPNMVWRVRVLQRLTGLEFRAATRAKLTPEETRALAPDAQHAVRFAGESRDLGMTWTAPADAQRAILKKWADWWDQDVRKPRLPITRHEDDRSWWY